MKAVLVFLLTSLVALPPSTAQIDHIVVGIRSLDEGIAQFAQLTGVKAGIGGKHPGRGTENALVSLGGGSYLEIVAPQAGATLSAEDDGMRRLARLTVIDWAVRVPAIDEAVDALQRAGLATSGLQPGARLTPSGERLEWSTFGFKDAGTSAAPFFIHWGANTRHPSTTAPGGCALDYLSVHDPQSDRVSTALHALGVTGVRVQAGVSHIEVALACGSNLAVLTGA